MELRMGLGIMFCAVHHFHCNKLGNNRDLSEEIFVVFEFIPKIFQP